MRAGQWLYKMAFAGVVCCFATSGQAATLPRVAVVVTQMKGAPQLRGEVSEAIEKPLGGHAELVSLDEFVRAARSAGLGPRAAMAEEAAVPAGRATRASHVLFVRSQPAPRVGGRRAGSQAVITLVDTVTGANALFRTLPLSHGQMGSAATGPLVAAITEVLNTLAGVAPLAQANAPAPGQAAGGAVAAAPASPAAQPAPPPPAAKPKEKDKEKDEEREVAAAEPSPAPAPAPKPEPLPIEPPPLEGEAVVSSDEGAQRLTLGVSAALGYMPFVRSATVSESGTDEVHYGAGPGASAPVFSRFVLRGELYPSRWDRRSRGHFYDRFGLGFELAIGAPATNVSSSATETHPAYTVQLEALYRQPLWRGPRATTLTPMLGYRRYGFGLPKTVSFPSVAYDALSLGLGLEIPLGTPLFAIQAAGHILPLLHVSGPGPAELGAQLGSGVGGAIEAGLRLSPIIHLDIIAQFTWSAYKADFVGGTTLPQVNPEYANVSLRDAEMGGRILIGTAF